MLGLCHCHLPVAVKCDPPDPGLADVEGQAEGAVGDYDRGGTPGDLL